MYNIASSQPLTPTTCTCGATHHLTVLHAPIPSFPMHQFSPHRFFVSSSPEVLVPSGDALHLCIEDASNEMVRRRSPIPLGGVENNEHHVHLLHLHRRCMCCRAPRFTSAGACEVVVLRKEMHSEAVEGEDARSVME